MFKHKHEQVSFDNEAKYPTTAPDPPLLEKALQIFLENGLVWARLSIGAKLDNMYGETEKERDREREMEE